MVCQCHNYDPIQGQGPGGLKCAKMADFKGYLRWYDCNQKTYLQEWHYLNFTGQIFYIHTLLASRDLQT